ncbi:MAG: protein-disulfide reductase DsbD N-terminal domain-containing protein [Candidatus Saccharicenans sp.]
MKVKKQKLMTLILILVSFLLLSSPFLKAESTEQNSQPELSQPIVTVKPIPPEGPILPGQTFDLILELAIASGYHINSDKPGDELLVATSVELKEDPFVKVKEIIFPEAKKKKFPFSEKPLSIYEGQIKIKVKMSLNESFKAKNLNLEGRLRYQACDNQACLRPMSVLFKVSLPVTSN